MKKKLGPFPHFLALINAHTLYKSISLILISSKHGRSEAKAGPHKINLISFRRGPLELDENEIRKIFLMKKFWSVNS